MATFNLDAARKAGYTDDQIAQGLAAQQGMDYAAAVKAGYSASDMLPSLVQGITQAKPADATKPGLIEDIGTGLMSAGGKVLGALDKGAVALSDAMPDWMPGKMTPEEAAMYSARGKAAQQFANENAPQRWSGQVASGLAYAPFMGAAPLVMGGAEGTARSQLLQDQGIDAATANKAGLAEGVLQGAIGALPLGEFVTGAGGKVLAKSVASSVGKAAVAGAGQSVASDAATQAYLDANGYDEQAKQFAPSVEKAAEGALFMGAFHGGMQGAHLVAGKAFDAATGNMAPQEAPAPSRDAVPNQSVVDQLRTVLGEPSPATGAVPRADLHASKEATIAQAKAADPVATADAVLAAPTIDDAMQAADSIINAPLPGLRDLTDGSDVRAAVDVGMGQPQTQPSTQTATDANLAGADGAFKVQPIEGQGNGIDTAGTERGTDGLGRSGGPADEVGSDLSAGRAGTGTGVIEGERDGSGLPAEKRGTDAGDYRTGADGTADAQPALTPESPEVSAKKSALRDRINAGKPFSVATSGDGTVSVGATLDANGHVALELTKAEHKAFKQSQADLELAKTQEERQAAKAAEQAALRPAVDRALVGESMPVAGAQPALIEHPQTDDELYAHARDLVIKTQSASRAELQNKLKIGFTRASRMVERMEADGIVSPAEPSGARTVLAKEVKTDVPERPQVPEEAPLARGEEGARQADTGAGATAGAGTTVAPAARDVAAARRGKVLEIERDDKTSATYRMLNDDGKQIGHVMTLKRKASVDGHIVDVVQIHNAGINDAASKGKGYGIRAYTELVDQALADGKHVWSDPSVSAEGARMYEALKRRGYKVEGNAQKPAVKDEDGTLVSNGNFVFKITGGPNAQAKPEGKLAARRALNDKQDAVVKAAAEKLAARKAEKEEVSPRYEKPHRVSTESDDLYNTRVDVSDYMNGDLSRAELLKRLTGRKMTDAQLGMALMRTGDHALHKDAENVVDTREQAASSPASSEAPAPDANPARAEPPMSFMKKVKVDHDVYIKDEGRWETVKVQAHVALKSVREDIGNLEALLKCMRG